MAKAEKLLSDNNLSLQSDSTRNTNITSIPNQINFPKLELPKFSGSIDAWPSFADAFCATVHNDDVRLTNVQKLIYLRSCLKDKAANKINTLSTTDVNYDIAWELLEKSYNDPNQVVLNHIKAFFKLPRCEQPSADMFGDIEDQVRKHFRTLQALKTPFYEAFPIHCVTTQLDEETLLKWREISMKTESPTLDNMLDFLHDRQIVLRDKPSAKTIKSNIKNNIKNVKQNDHNSSTTFSAQTSACCHLYKGAHYTQTCKELTDLTIEDRIKLIDKTKLCANCFRANHTLSACRAGGCKTCGKRHHTLLHREATSPPSNNITCLRAVVPCRILLSTALINIRDANGKVHEAKALLDSCSQTNFISARLAERLGVPMRDIRVPVTGINNETNYYTRELDALISSPTSKFSRWLSFLIRKDFGTNLPGLEVNQSDLNIPSNIELADPHFYRPGEVDLLLGAKIFYKLIISKQKMLNDRDVVLQRTQFSWVVAGEVAVESITRPVICNLVNKFWEIEQVPNKKLLSVEEEFWKKHFVNNVSRDSLSGKYIVRLPFKTNKNYLGHSYNVAIKRFLNLEHVLNKNSSLKDEYKGFLKTYESLGHMVECEHSPGLCYLPHHGVIKQSSLTTKLRVVFDASSKTTSGLSLNDILCVVPVVQENLFSIVLRFRIHAYVLTTDVEKMYRQILLHPDDSPASYLATRTLIKLAEDEGASLPDAARVLKHDFYMDDLLTSAQLLTEATKLRDDKITITTSGGMPLRKWASNYPELTKNLNNSNDSEFINLNSEKTLKTLGLFWDSQNDLIKYVIDSQENSQYTKRVILSVIARLFDPLGLLGPIIIRGKILLQRLWQIRLGWDDLLPRNLRPEWETYRKELINLNDIEIDRKIVIADYIKLDLHGFDDASKQAYMRSVDKYGNILTRLTCAKSKVAPLKIIQLPRLELCTALLLSQLVSTVRSSFRTVEFNSITCWSDSTVTLNWINTPPHTLKTFFSNRVAEIQTLTEAIKWRYILSDDNPADIISRGCSPAMLRDNKLWLEGPSWLVKHCSEWPESSFVSIEVPEKGVLSGVVVETKKNELLQRYSSFNRLTRITARCLRFINNCRACNKIRDDVLTVDELKVASELIIKLVQIECFSEEIKYVKAKKHIESNLVNLNPFIDQYGILRVGGRLKHANIPFERKHQAILPKHHHVMDTIIRNNHVQAFHAGAQATLCIIRDKYWIIDGRQYIRCILYNCIPCRRAKPIVPEYIMGNLPKNRVNYTRPFLHTGIDLCGLFFIKEKRKRNRNKVKIYIGVFVCFSTRAIHIDLVKDLSSEALLGALRRFFARRGRASDIYTDNATNFVGANRTISEISQFLSDKNYQKHLHNVTSDLSVRWHFIPPRAPHFRGLWEVAVKSVKRHLMHIVKNTLLTYEALLTYVNEIEAILNSRPLVPLSSDPNDLNVLTPGHFLIGEAMTSLPEKNYENVNPNHLSQWEQVQKMKQHFWSR